MEEKWKKLVKMMPIYGYLFDNRELQKDNRGCQKDNRELQKDNRGNSCFDRIK